MKVAVLTSGGVDSSVALNLLKEQGHDVTAFYLKIWLEDELAYLGDCPWEEDLSYVQKICSTLGVPLEVLPMQKDYWDKIVRYTIEESRAGRTPNPDVLCNQFIKFGLFYERISSDFEKVATGHYARVEERMDSQAHPVYHLLRAPDPVKDQTYFLARLTQRQLSRALFPIGHLMKKEVRELARRFDLPNQDRKDSQGICFLGKFKYREFLRHQLGESPGDFIEAETGVKIGKHIGYFHYTIGQRKGLDLPGGPWFVVRKNIAENQVFISRGYAPEAVYQTEFQADSLHWILGTPPSEKELKVKIRHGMELHPCILTLNDNRATVTLKEPVHGVAAGQFAVFYQDDECLGSGVIV